MATEQLAQKPARLHRRCPNTTPCRCTASTTSSSMWATPPRPRTTSRTRSASRRRPTGASRPAVASVSHTCSSRDASGSCSPARSRAATRSPPTMPGTATACTRSPSACPTPRRPMSTRWPTGRAAWSRLIGRRTSTGACSSPPSRPTATRCTCSSIARATRGPSCPATSVAPRRPATPTACCSWASTTSSGTWSSATWRSGWPTTSASSA